MTGKASSLLHCRKLLPICRMYKTKTPASTSKNLWLQQWAWAEDEARRRGGGGGGGCWQSQQAPPLSESNCAHLQDHHDEEAGKYFQESVAPTMSLEGGRGGGGGWVSRDGKGKAGAVTGKASSLLHCLKLLPICRMNKTKTPASTSKNLWLQQWAWAGDEARGRGGGGREGHAGKASSLHHCLNQVCAHLQDHQDEEAGKYFQESVAPTVGLMGGGGCRKATVDQDIDIGTIAFVDMNKKPERIHMLNSWFHDGLAGTSSTSLPWFLSPITAS